MRNHSPNEVFYYVTIKDKAYVEPDHSSHMENTPSDAILRVFEHKDDAQRYADIVVHYEMENPDSVFVSSALLSYLLKTVQSHGERLRKETGDNLRLDSCKMEPEQHPETLEVIYRYSPQPKYLN